jgi:hypothetical protein
LKSFDEILTGSVRFLKKINSFALRKVYSMAENLGSWHKGNKVKIAAAYIIVFMSLGIFLWLSAMEEAYIRIEKRITITEQVIDAL